MVHEPLVRTFPAYAFGLLRRAAALRGEPSPRLLTGPEQDLVIRELLDVVGPDDEDGADPIGWPAHLRPALRTRAFAEQLRDLLLRAAERGIGPVELARLGERLGRDDWLAAARFLREYVAVLALRDATTRGSVAYDAAELVRAATGLLDDDPELLAAERGRLDFVYVDELADTDPAQIDLLHRVAGGGLPLVAFADPDSSTFAFRGADPAGVTTFPHRFRTASGAVARTVTLRTDYRSSGPLFEATGRVARRLRGPVGHRRALPAPDAPPGSVEVRTLRSRTSEAAYVAHALREAHLLDGVPWSRMAVVVRSTTLQLARAAAGAALGRRADRGARRRPAAAPQPAVAPLLLLLRCALEPVRLDEEAAVALLHSPLGGADPLAERRLRQGLRTLALAAGDRRPSGELLVEALRDPAELAVVERRWAAPAKSVARLLATARDAAAEPASTAEDVLWAVWRATGLGDRWYGAIVRAGRATGEPDNGPRWRAEAADRDLDAVVVLFDAAARFVDRLPGARIEVFLDHVLGQQLPADTIAPSADRGDAVRLLTAHAAKGLEWDLVAVAGVQEGVWPDLRLRGTLLGSERLVDVVSGRADETGVAASLVGQASALLDEERRLFYVAATRARRRLLVSAVNSSAVGGADHEEQPSRFLHELLGPSGGGDGPGDPPTPPDEPPPDEPPTEEPDDDGDGDLPPDPDDLPVDDDGRVIWPDDEWPEVTPPGGGAPAPAVVRPRAGDDTDDLPLARPPRAMTLSALVAELRTAATDPTASATRRHAAAGELARLAAAGVPGANPDDWWGLRPLSDDRPLADAGETVRVTPSTMESALRCSLRWLLERHGGAAPASAAQGIGNLVHAAAMLAEDAAVDRERLIEYVAARFDAIDLAARWLAGPERERAEAMVDKLLRWLAANPRRLLAIEQEFAVRLGRPDPARSSCAAGSTGSRSTPTAGWSWSTSRPAAPRRPPKTSPSIRSSPPTRWPSRRARSTSTAPTPAARRWCSSAPPPRRRRSRSQPPLDGARGPGLGAGAGAAHRRHDGRVDVPRHGQQPLPGLPGPHELPDLGQGPPGRGAAVMTATVAFDHRTGCRAGRPRAGPRYTPVELAKCSACGTRRRPSSPRSSPRRSSRCWWSPAPARARPRRWRPGWSGWSPTATPRPTRSSASPSPARRPASWPTACGCGSASSSAGSAAPVT